MAEIFVATVVQRVANLAVDSLVQETCRLLGVGQKVNDMDAELRQLQAYLKDADTMRREGNNSVQNWLRHLRDVALDAENVLEEVSNTTKRNKMKKGFTWALLRYAYKPSYLKKLRHISVQIDQINRELGRIFDRASRYAIKITDQSPAHEHETRRQVSPDSEENVEVIGFDNYRNQIVEQLVNPENKLLTVVSIVGMGGIGKSTLARKVYNDPHVKQIFDVLVWVAVSQTYEVHQLLKEIMKQIMRNEPTREMNEEETRRTLRDFLEDKKYLIVLDDVWETTTWHQLQVASIRVFPEAKKGCRIVLTTRKLEVAQYPDQRREIHELELLDKENSWELLRSKAFPSYQDVSERTQRELEYLGRKLAEKCDGLPLALIILGGYLSKNLDYHRWSRLVLGVDWEVTDTIRNLEGVLALSYRDLPHHYLKACFLYIASFPEDNIIPASTLIELWIAEGFLPHRQGYELKETAHNILEELAQRCMVQVAWRSIKYGWIDSIRIHDVLRDWAIGEGRIDGFINVWNNNQDVEASGSNAMPAYRVTLMNNFFKDQFSAATPNLRTLLAFKLSPNLVSQIGRLRFLRVLLLEGLALEEIKFPEEMKGMIHLRYLGLRHCNYVELPSSMWRHLLNLQTLDARGTSIICLPSSFWDIPTLRNVYLDDVTFPISPKPNCQRSLQTLYIIEGDSVKYQRSDPTAQFRRRCSLVRKFDVEATIRSLVGTTPLVSLTLGYWGSRPIPSDVLSGFLFLHQLSLNGPLKKLPNVSLKLPDVSLLPKNLRELELVYSKLEEDPMPILEKLPSLVLLQLISDAYTGSIMRCSSDGFPHLQILTLVNLKSVTEWTVEEGAMPDLTHLELDTLPNLKMVPEEGLQLLMSLKQLTLRDSLSTGNFKELEEEGCKVMIIRE